MYGKREITLCQKKKKKPLKIFLLQSYNSKQNIMYHVQKLSDDQEKYLI